MFTGIIRNLGKIQNIEVNADKSVTFWVDSPVMSELKAGDSVAVNGVCLTKLPEGNFRLMQETLSKTNLGDLAEDDEVNLEMPMTAGERFDGHFVQGHVDGVAEITYIEEAGEDRAITFKAPEDLKKYLAPKGSVALDGVSLTVVDVADDVFRVSFMPYTLEKTNFGKREAGEKINIECDMLAKQVVSALENYN